MTATTVERTRSLLAEGEALMSGAPVRDPLADHLITLAAAARVYRINRLATRRQPKRERRIVRTNVHLHRRPKHTMTMTGVLARKGASSVSEDPSRAAWLAQARAYSREADPVLARLLVVVGETASRGQVGGQGSPPMPVPSHGPVLEQTGAARRRGNRPRP